MKTFEVRLMNSALNDLDKITDYLKEKSLKAASKIINDIFDSYDQLEIFPLSGSYPDDEELISKGFRKLISGNYISLYRYIDDVVYIYHIYNALQNYESAFKNQLYK